MDIAICLDENFVSHSGIMMTSLCENNIGEDITFHIVSTGLPAKRKEELDGIAKKYQACIRFYDIDDNLTAKMPIGQKGQSYHMQSIASYYRLFLSSTLPDDIDKILYLDGDIIINGSLRNLWETNMEGYGIAAVPDVLFCKDYHTSRLGYPQEQGYCNAGVLMMNLKFWRENKIEDICLDFVESSAEKIICHDQDVINWVFRDRKILLDLKYNVQQDFLYSLKHQKLSKEFYGQLETAQKNPVIIHYIYGIKPWHKECLHPLRKLYLEYKAMTKWADLPLQKYFDGSSRKKDAIHRFLYWAKNSPKSRWAVSRL